MTKISHHIILRSVFALLLVFLHFSLLSTPRDTTKKNYFFGLKYHFGSILPHAPDLKIWSGTYPWGFRFDAGKFRNDKKSWEQCKCYSKTGLSAIWFSFGNPDTLGYGYGGMLFYEPLLTYHKRLFLSLTAGIGPVYLTKPYDEKNNPANQFFSSSISYLMLMHLNLNYRLKPHINIVLSACYKHISNGGMKQPNRGINFPGISAGIEYQPKQKHFTTQRISDWRDNSFNRFRFDFSAFATAKSISATHEHKSKILPVYGLYSGASMRLGRMNGIAAGTEFTSDGYVKELMRRKGKSTDHHNGAILLGHELIIGKIIFAQMLGIYLYKPYIGDDDPIYQRYRLRYQYTDHLFAGMTLKAHRHVAHIFDVRFGMNF